MPTRAVGSRGNGDVHAGVAGNHGGALDVVRLGHKYGGPPAVGLHDSSAVDDVAHRAAGLLFEEDGGGGHTVGLHHLGHGGGFGGRRAGHAPCGDDIGGQAPVVEVGGVVGAGLHAGAEGGAEHVALVTWAAKHDYHVGGQGVIGFVVGGDVG